jgi:hypothetical protein
MRVRQRDDGARPQDARCHKMSKISYFWLAPQRLVDRCPPSNRVGVGRNPRAGCGPSLLNSYGQVGPASHAVPQQAPAWPAVAPAVHGSPGAPQQSVLPAFVHVRAPQHAPIAVASHVSFATEQHRESGLAPPVLEAVHVRPSQHESGLRTHLAPPVRHGAHSSAVPSISDPRALHTPLQHAGAKPVQRVPNGVHWGAPGGFGALAQKLPSQIPVQQSEALSAVQGCPTGLQEHLRFPFRPPIEKRWQHCLQPSFFAFFPRGFFAGHFLPLGIQASAETPSFLARTSSPSPRAASTEAPNDPPTRERRDRLCASR